VRKVNEAIILAGGESWRLKPDIWIPKPMLKVNTWTLLEYQIKWLKDHKFDHIIIASREKYPIHMLLEENVEWSITSGRGTGGDLLVASDYLRSNKVYVMNVDDIILGYNPLMMYNIDCQACILVSKPRIGYGRVELRRDLVLNFKEKPLLDFYVSTGHYVFKKHIFDKYFHDIGSLEEDILPELAKRRILKAERLPGKWITLNTMKDYLYIKELLGR